MRKLYHLNIVLFLLFTTRLAGQYYETGQDPASLRWSNIETEHFRLIFPRSYSDEATRLAFVFEQSYSLIQGMYGDLPARRLPVIVHPLSTRANGYVAWAPGRVELYPYSGQNTIPMSQTEQLALHELVHVAQMQGLRNGISRPLEYILGEQLPGALSIFTPFWFLEGEAVVAESVLSNSGRGRQPAFEQELRALVVDREIYSYDKMINGSYRDFTPDHYRFGYQMSAYARANYGDSLFLNALQTTSSRPYFLNPFNISLKRDAGITKKKLYDSTFVYLREQWENYDKLMPKSNFTILSGGKEGEYVSYHSPQPLGRDSIVAIRRELSKTPSFVLLTGGGKSEERLISPGYMWPYRISAGGDLIAWAEQRPDPRWENRDFSVIRTYNLKTGLANTISQNSRLFAPAVSPDGYLVACSETTAENINSLVVINSRSGTELLRTRVPGNRQVIYPVWSTDGKKIVFISLSDEGEGIMSYNYAEGSWSVHLEPGHTDLQSVFSSNDTLLFVSAESGIDNVYFLAGDRSPVRITSSRFGISDISMSGDMMIFSDCSADGNRISSFHTGEIYSDFNETVSRVSLLSDIDTREKLDISDYEEFSSTIQITPYRKWQHLFRFHSWMPFYTDINSISFDNTTISPGITLMSQNNLSTLITSIGYEYSNGEHYLHNSITYKGWYPALELDINYGGIPVVYRDEDDLYSPSSVRTGIRTSGRIYLPLNFNSGLFNQALWPSLKVSYRNDYVYEEENSLFDYGQFLLTPRLYFSSLRRMSYRDIYPRWGFVVDLSATYSPRDSEIYGPVRSLRTSFYAPGLLANHGIRLSFQAEKQDFGKLVHYNRVSFPRGYEHIISGELTSFTCDYQFPLAYPDLRIGSLAYIKRIRGGLFYDYAFGSSNYYFREQKFVEDREYFSSTGAELLFDFSVLRIPLDLTGGIEAAWLPELEKPWFNLVFNIDIFGFVIGRDQQAGF